MEKVLEIVAYPDWLCGANKNIQESPFTETDLLACLIGVIQSRYSESIDLRIVEPQSDPLPDVDFVPNVPRGIVIPSYYLQSNCELHPRQIVQKSEWYRWGVAQQPKHMFLVLNEDHWSVLWIVRQGKFKPHKIMVLDPQVEKDHFLTFSNTMHKYSEPLKKRIIDFVNMFVVTSNGSLTHMRVNLLQTIFDKSRINSGPITALSIACVMNNMIDKDKIDLPNKDPSEITYAYECLKEAYIDASFSSDNLDTCVKLNLLEPSNKEGSSELAEQGQDAALTTVSAPFSALVHGHADVREYLDPTFRKVFPRIFNVATSANLIRSSVITNLPESQVKTELLSLNFLDYVSEADILTEKQKKALANSKKVTYPQSLFEEYHEIFLGKKRKEKLMAIFAKVLHGCIDAFEFNKSFVPPPALSKILQETNMDILQFLHHQIDTCVQIQAVSYRIQDLFVNRFYRHDFLVEYEQGTGYPIVNLNGAHTRLVPPLGVMVVVDEVLSTWGLTLIEPIRRKIQISDHTFISLVTDYLDLPDSVANKLALSFRVKMEETTQTRIENYRKIYDLENDSSKTLQEGNHGNTAEVINQNGVDSQSIVTMEQSGAASALAQENGQDGDNDVQIALEDQDVSSIQQNDNQQFDSFQLNTGDVFSIISDNQDGTSFLNNGKRKPGFETYVNQDSNLPIPVEQPGDTSSASISFGNQSIRSINCPQCDSTEITTVLYNSTGITNENLYNTSRNGVVTKGFQIVCLSCGYKSMSKKQKTGKADEDFGTRHGLHDRLGKNCF